MSGSGLRCLQQLRAGSDPELPGSQGKRGNSGFDIPKVPAWLSAEAWDQGDTPFQRRGKGQVPSRSQSLQHHSQADRSQARALAPTIRRLRTSGGPGQSALYPVIRANKDGTSQEPGQPSTGHVYSVLH